MRRHKVFKGSMILLLISALSVSFVMADDLYVGSGHPYPTIQLAVDAASSGDVLHIATGIYEEQVSIIGKDLTLIGDTGATILAPLLMAGVSIPGTPTTYFTPMYVKNADVVIRNLTVDGAARGTVANNRFCGIVYDHSGGEISGCIVKDFREGVLSGRYLSYSGIVVLNMTDAGPDRRINILNNTIFGFQKNGITVYGVVTPSPNATKAKSKNKPEASPLKIKTKKKNKAASGRIVTPTALKTFAEIRNNTVLGQGVLNYIAQNGIQLSYADGIIAENHISSLGYSGPDWVATGILVYYSSMAQVENNILLNCEDGTYAYDSSGLVFQGNNLNQEPAFIAQVTSNPEKNTDRSGLQASNCSVQFISNSVRNVDYAYCAWHCQIPSIRDNRADNNLLGIYAYDSEAPLIIDNCITNNDYGLYLNSVTGAVDARLNYWGSTDGPSGAGFTGSGDSITLTGMDPALLDASTWINGCEVGNLEVLITPAAPVALGATWSIDGGTTNHSSGQILSNLPAGVYSVTFSSVEGWASPAPLIVEVVEDALTTATGVYTQNSGDLRVLIEPAGAVAAGAGWRIKGHSGWRSSGSVAEGITSGSVVVEFNNVDGWNKPANIPVSIYVDQVVTVTGTYNQTSPTSGAISIVFEDDPNWVKEARWRVRGSTGEWLKSGDIVAGLPFGNAGIEYKVIPGYILPDLGSATVKPGVSTYRDVKYVRPLIIHKSDYNGDGTDDLAVFEESSGKWMVASIASPGDVQPSKVYNILEEKFGKANDVPVTGDYNGDGKADLAYYRPQTGIWRVDGKFKIKKFGRENDIPVPGDYNGDGTTDAALYRPETGEWIFYDLEKEEVSKVTFGSESEVPVPGNWNGDKNGQTDLAVYDVVTGKWRVAVYNSKKQKWVRAPKYNLTYGAPGEIPIQADYDGDGKTDHAVFAADSNTWKVYDQFNLEFGKKGDVPVPNDWAGLGRVIPAIFRAKNGRWLAPDGLLTARHGRGGTPLMSGR